LARARNDQKFVNDRGDKMKEQNIELQGQIKQLSTTKVALEKTISRLTDEKENMQKKLVETESVIQGRIDEIWKIKQSLDQKLTDSSMRPTVGQMDLPPIVVNASGRGSAAQQQQQAQTVVSQQIIVQAPVSDKKASVISLNEANNFIITDLGQDSGARVGDTLKAYRGNKEIATLEVIQARKDICAADIKQKNDALHVGDTIKLIH
jgi:hypothetical protein